MSFNLIFTTWYEVSLPSFRGRNKRGFITQGMQYLTQKSCLSNYMIPFIYKT